MICIKCLWEKRRIYLSGISNLDIHTKVSSKRVGRDCVVNSKRPLLKNNMLYLVLLTFTKKTFRVEPIYQSKWSNFQSLNLLMLLWNFGFPLQMYAHKSSAWGSIKNGRHENPSPKICFYRFYFLLLAACFLNCI